MTPCRPLLLLALLGPLAGCDHVRPSPIGLNWIHQGRNLIPVCTD